MDFGAFMQIIGGILILFGLLGIADLLLVRWHQPGMGTEPPKSAPQRHSPSQYLMTHQDWAERPSREE